MTDNLISVIVPIYNVENFASECIESIINQSYKNFEIILVDDGSTDSSGKICDAYAKKDKRIKVIHKKNGGLSDARNFGIKAAKGSLLSFIDGDDKISPIMLEVLCQAINKNKCDIATCKFSYDDKKLNENFDCDIKIKDLLPGNKAIKYLFNDHICGNYAWNKLYKKELFNDIVFPKGRYFEDIYIMHKIFLRAKKVVILDEKLYHYVVRDGQITNGESVPFKVIKDHIGAFEERFKDNNLAMHKDALYKSFLNCVKRCKRLAIQNKVKDENKKVVIKYVNSKIKKYCTRKNLSANDYIQCRILYIFNHIAILAHITKIKKLIK